MFLNRSAVHLLSPSKHCVRPGAKCIVRFLSSSTEQLLDRLAERGNIINSFPPRLEKKYPAFIAKQTCVYAGFDPTGDSLHLGHLLVLTNLLRLHCNGIRAIAVVGSATARLGDPSGKTKFREKLSVEQIEANADLISSQIRKIAANFYDFYAERDPNLGLDSFLVLVGLLADNWSWYKDVNVIEFLAQYASVFPLGSFFIRSVVRERMTPTGGGINVAEFVYPLMQAYDFLHLHKEYGCGLQIGGQDQLLNIDRGHDLVKFLCGAEVGGLLTPLITSSDGKKIGKTESSDCMYLGDWKTSPFSLYQYLVRIPDSDVEQLCRLLTDRPLQQIENDVEKRKNDEPWYAQRLLAEFVVKLVHGEEGLADALNCTRALFSTEYDWHNLTKQHVKMLIDGGVAHSAVDFAVEERMVDLLVRCGLVQKMEQILSVLKSGGLRINGQKIRDPHLFVNWHTHVVHSNKCTFVSVGKRKHFIIEWTNYEE